MGLFDKKTCAVCGKQFGLLGGSSIADGQVCNDCKRKLSPYATSIKKMTTADFKRHLEYREKNEAELASFNPDIVLGTDIKVYFDTHKGAFLVSSRTNFRDGNPDIISRNQVVNAEYRVNERAEEIYKDEETKESYDPKKYEYDFTFMMKLSIDSPYFDEINFEVKDGDEAELKNDENYNRHEYTCRMIQHVLCPKLYPEPVKEEPVTPIPLEADTWTCSCGQTGNTGKFCSACGKEHVVTWDCPNCGQKGNTGKFCSECGEAMPANVRQTVEVKRITPTIVKPGMREK